MTRATKRSRPMKIWKWTDQLRQTRNQYQWIPNKWSEVLYADTGEDLCSRFWLHCYNSPVLALVFNVIHGNYQPGDRFLWQGEVDGAVKYDNGRMKMGAKRMRIIKRIKFDVTLKKLLWFGLLLIMTKYKVKWYRDLAERWLAGEMTSTAIRTAIGKHNTVGFSWVKNRALDMMDLAATLGSQISADALAKEDHFNSVGMVLELFLNGDGKYAPILKVLAKVFGKEWVS